MTRLDRLRQHLKNMGLDGLIIPMSDPFQNEFVPPQYERLRWVTGFTGSAGLCIVTHDRAVLFIDSRYTLQAKEEAQGFETLPWSREVVQSWSKETPSVKMAYDPWLMTKTDMDFFKTCFDCMIELRENPIDAIWIDRLQGVGSKPAFALDIIYAGVPSDLKRSQVVEILSQQNCEAAFLTDLTSIAWLLNMRGHDVPYCPLLLSYALVHGDKTVDLFVDSQKVDAALQKTLDVRLYPLEDVEKRVKSFKGPLLVKKNKTPWALIQQIQNPIYGEDPCERLKAIKNTVEQQGFRDAHIQDGVAVTRFLAHLHLDRPTVDELGAAHILDQVRLENPSCKGLSFPTISAAGANAALPHYRPTQKTSLPLTDLYLVDSGGQYFMGTTDITRTLWLGEAAPPASLKHHYTLVLKGHIALARAVFPKGTPGAALDILARQFLYAEGLNYGHGTGHGVGHFLGVHEGPQSISPNRRNLTPLEVGMVVSNEPGLYLEGSYGIRLENLVLVQPHTHPDFNCFETLSLAPFDLQLIDFAMLTDIEKEWLKTYHARVLDALKSLLDAQSLEWLEKLCMRA